MYDLPDTAAVLQSLKVDNASFALLPYDAPEDMLPCRIIGDGNCLPDVVVFSCLGQNSTEVRMRVAQKLAENEVYYPKGKRMTT